VVTGIDDATKQIAIQFDNGVEKKIATSEYGHIHYGWATTTHKAQGMTVDRAFVYGHSAEAMATAETTYVQISRSREETRLYIVGGEVAVERPADIEKSHIGNGERSLTIKNTLDEMKRSWSRSGAKDTTLDYQKDVGITEKAFELTR
jgi:ATP-dependent exoDNAse (exonuclease V) alpha subunit